MEPITLITVAIAVVSVMATGFAYFRSSAVKVWEQNSAAYKARVDLLEEQNRTLMERIGFLESRIVELESHRGEAAVTQIVAGVDKAVTQIVAAYEVRAATIAADLAARKEG